MQKRYLEIDIVRSVAIFMMIVYHFVFDLNAFTDISIDMKSTGWEIFRIITASLFLIISGISTNLSSHPLKRALIVIGASAIISIGTYIYDPNTFIRFGILHCIGTGMLILIIMKSFKEFNIIIGMLIILIFQILNFKFLTAIALTTAVKIIPPHTTLDYYPLLPWIGYMLIGSGIGHFIYIRNNFMVRKTYSKSLMNLTLLGRHALLVYIIHQPILISLLVIGNWLLVIGNW